MRGLVFVSPSLLLAAGLTAQVTTYTPVGVATSAPGLPTVLSGLPQYYAAMLPYQELTSSPSGLNGALLSIAYPNVIHTHAARISTTVFLVGPSAVTAGTTPSQSAAGVTFGAVEFLVTFHALPGRTGHWTLLADEVTSPSLGTTSLVNHTMIDVNADGTIEATSPSGPVSVPLVIPASGSLVVKVSVENHGASTGFLYSSTQTDIRMNLDPINGFGFACGGATSVGTVGAMVPTTGWSTFTLSSSGGFPNMPTLSVFGTQTAGPLLPGGCGLFTDPMIVVPFLADAAGAAVHTFDVHATHYGTLYHQFLPLDLATFTFRSSNGLRIICW